MPPLYEMARWLSYIMTDLNGWLGVPVDGDGKPAVTGELVPEAKGLAVTLFAGRRHGGSQHGQRKGAALCHIGKLSRIDCIAARA